MKLETQCLHAGYSPDPTTHACAVPLYRTSSFVFDNTEHAANLFALKELGNIYSRIMNPTQDVLEQRVAQLEGERRPWRSHQARWGFSIPLSMWPRRAENIVSANNLYGGTYTQFNDLLPDLGITTKFVEKGGIGVYAMSVALEFPASAGFFKSRRIETLELILQWRLSTAEFPLDSKTQLTVPYRLVALSSAGEKNEFINLDTNFQKVHLRPNEMYR